MADGETSIPASFANPPRMAAVFRDRYNDSAAAQQPVESQHVTQGSAPLQQDPNPLDKPYVEPVSQPVQIGPESGQPPAQPQQSSVQQPVYPQYELDNRALKELAAERDALRYQLSQYQEAQKQWERQNAEARLMSQLDESPELRDLDSVDPEDARRIAYAASRVMQSRVDDMQKELDAQRAAAQQGWAAWQQNERAKAEELAAKQVLAAHPDFFDLYKNSTAFTDFLQGHDGYSSKTRDQQAMEEFYAGNTAYVIDLVDRFKGIQRQHTQPTSVAPVQVAGAAVSQQPRQTQVSYTLADLNNLMQTRQISQDEYREKLKAWRAANSN